LKTTHIEIVRYSRTLVANKGQPTVEDDRLTVDLTRERLEMDAGRPESYLEIEQHKPFILRLHEFFMRRRL
jgi:hypothetical protein